MCAVVPDTYVCMRVCVCPVMVVLTHMHMHAHIREELMLSSAGPEDKKVDVLLQREQTIAEVRQYVECSV